MYTILLVEDSPLIQAHLHTALSDIEHTKVVGVAACEQTALRAIEAHNPELTVLDLQLESGSGFGILKRLGADTRPRPVARVVVFSNHANNVIKHRCLALGAHAFFDKSFQLDDLVQFVRQQAHTKHP
jgi:DNA-binding NarL/FixJ family response regulator